MLSFYRLDTSWRGLAALAGCMVFAVAFVEFYRRTVASGNLLPDHCTHDGETTPAGWIHALFLCAFLWFAIQVYLGLTVPQVSRFDIIWISIVLSPFFYLGVRKFEADWVFDNGAKIQVAVLTTGLWALAAWRLWPH